MRCLVTADCGVLMQVAVQLKSIQKRLNATVASQKYHRRREARGRSSAESLNERVQYWSVGQSVVLIVVALAQVAMVRRLFAGDNRRRRWSILGVGV